MTNGFGSHLYKSLFNAYIVEATHGSYRTVVAFTCDDEGLCNGFAGAVCDDLHDRTGRPFTYHVETLADVRALYADMRL